MSDDTPSDAVMKLAIGIFETDWSSEHGDKVEISASDSKWLAHHIAEYVEAAIRAALSTTHNPEEK